MAVLALDTSALIRRYDRREAGSAAVRTLCRRATGHSLLIAQVTPVEVASALARKGREGLIGPSELDQIWRLFRQHRRLQYRVLAVTEVVYARAERLLFTHSLRAYDAIQLATALAAADLLRGLTADFRFCTADRLQANAARAEGLTVELIA
jgi:predicted nucleic acid-binding protein